mgnify:CR=1 FL=1
MTEKLGRKITLIAVLIVLAIAVLILPSRPFRLGLDLQGGTRLVYRFDFEEAARRGQISKADLSNKEGLLDSFKEIIHQRLDPKGVKEISIRKQGSDQLVIELPGAAEFQSETITWKLGAELAAGERTQLVLDPGPGEGATAKEKTEAVEKIKAFPLTGGMVRVGSESIQYTVREGNVLRALQRGMDKTEVAGHASGALVDLLTSNELETIITSIGDLQFMIVAQQNDPELARFNTDLGKETQKRDAWIKANPGRSIEEFNLLESAQGGPAGSLRWYPKRVERGQIETPAVERLEGVLVTSNPEWIFTGSDLKRVEPSQDQSGLPAVHLEIADAKKSAFTEFTTTHIGRQMAIVLNREIATDPVIKSKLPGSCVIEGGAGGFTLKQVQDLVRILKSGSLRVKPTLLDRARVGASLGQDYILTGIYSAIAALALIVVFMLVFYRKLGLFSVIGLVLNLLFLMAGLAFLRATITLPGVAGIILTLGMAVDGNILIYERLREELARGLKLIQACKASFERAAVAIIDSNLTTLISGVILQYVGTGPIRGFAVTLNIGILSTLFTVIVVTEALVLLDLKRGTTKLTMAPMFAAPKIRFMANYKKFLYTSWAIALLGFVLLASSPREKVWGIDFQGGFTMKVRTAEPMQVDALRERVSKIAGAIGESEVKEISDSAVAGRGYTVFSITYKRTDNSLDTSKTSSGRAELEVPWRGTWRRGLLSFRAPTEIFENPALVEEAAPLPSGRRFDQAAAGAGADDAANSPWDEVEEPLVRQYVRFTAADTMCELDWEVQVVPVGAPVELRDGPPTLVLWVPGEAGDEDLGVLRRLTVLQSDDPRLDAAEVDREALASEVEAEGGLVFHHLYLEKGRFVGPGWELKSSEQAARETVVGLLARVLDDPFELRFPEHPVFAGELDEGAVRLLVEKLFVGGAGTPNVQQAAAALAAPLGLAEAADGGQFRFNPNGETALLHPFNVEPLRLAETAGDFGVPLDAFYQALRREPFGLQPVAQRLILAGLVGSGRLKLSGPTGELTASGLATAGDLEGYTHVFRAGLAVYPNDTLLEWARLIAEVEDLDDLVTPDGRQKVRQALENWLDRWQEMDLKARFNEVPDEAATRRTWQLISASKQYFDTTARCVEGILIEEISLEEGLGRIVTTFAAKPAIYQRAIRDLKMLTSFVEWVPYYSEAKEYVLSADRTPEASVEAERVELIDFISAPHRLLEETKRRRFEAVYEAFQQHYADYYASSHDLHVGSRADFDALAAYLDSETWARFELLSQVKVVNSRYFQFAGEFVTTIRDLACDMPTRELLRDRPLCLCGFRLGNTDSVARMCERLRMIVEQGTADHIQTIRQFRQTILVGMRTMDADAAYADASVPLISLLSGGDKIPEVTPSTVELINNCLAGQPSPVLVGMPPALEQGLAISKQDLRARLLAWLDDLPGDEGDVFEVSRLLPASADE